MGSTCLSHSQVTVFVKISPATCTRLKSGRPVDKACRMDSSARAVAEVLRDVVQRRPQDLFGTVVAELEKKSGRDPKEFEAYFLECSKECNRSAGAPRASCFAEGKPKS
ncbi:unnamed protein product [Effrenium voratum]|nr:unnamed protein product [Effrenium voratum]